MTDSSYACVKAVGASVLCVLMSAAVARADWNAQSIAVPLIGTAGAAHPYPSRVTITPPGGPAQVALPYIKLFRVTHSCPDDLAVLLVHNDTDKYLLMSNAGGCRALRATDVYITAFGSVLPDNDASSTPYGATLSIGASIYGPQPTFPAPAPAGPYVNGLPDPLPLIGGTWDLYVMDRNGSNRGVIAGGWSLDFYTSWFHQKSEPGTIAIPSSGTAASYPITFDFSDVPAGVLVGDMELAVRLSHGYADDLRMVLQSPSGTAVAVMANAGGNTPLTDFPLYFRDTAVAAIPDDGPVSSGTHKPGSVYDGFDGPLPSLPGPAPPGPYALAFSTFANEPARGIWKLWVYDRFDPDGGEITGASIFIEPELGNPTFAIEAPTTADTYTSTDPFVRILGSVTGARRPISAVWRSITTTGELSGAGACTVRGAGGGEYLVQAIVPVRKGQNRVNIDITTAGNRGVTDRLTITVDEFTYVLSEGATGGFFDEDVTLGNPTDAAAPVSVSFLQEGAAPITHPDAVPANAPLQLRVDDLVPGGAVSTVVHSTNGVPLAVERTMSWDARGYGGHGGTAIAPSTQWLFAEGSQGFFDTFLLLANDNAAAAGVTMRFLLEGGGVVNHPVTVPAHARLTIYTGDIPELVNTSFGMDVIASAPITAERSMYFPHGGGRTFEGGHEAAGATVASTHWFLAEGATGPFFDCFILLSNPSSSVAHTTVKYLLLGRETITQTVDVPANGRTTINVETVDPRLANAAVSTVVTSNRSIVVERSMYWPDIASGWREAHNSIGLIDPALRWGVSDVRVGGPREHQTYILLANPNDVPAEVQVRLLRVGASPVVQTYTLPPTSRTNVVAADLASNVAGTYSADVQVLNYQPIVVEKALYWNAESEIWAAGTGVVATPLPPP